MMGWVVLIALFVVVYLIRSAYDRVLRKGMRERQVLTHLSASQVREIFAGKVARLGWSIVDDDNPMVVQSPLTAGRRQQIAMTFKVRSDGRTVAKVRPVRIWTKGGLPYKAHTLRMRLNAFTAGIHEADPHAQSRVMAD